MGGAGSARATASGSSALPGRRPGHPHRLAPIRPLRSRLCRETEWEAAQTVLLWRDGAPAMQWKSRLAGTGKIERAGLLTLALAALLLRGGERVRLLAPAARTASARGLERLAEELARQPPSSAAARRDAPAACPGGADQRSARPLADIQATSGGWPRCR